MPNFYSLMQKFDAHRRFLPERGLVRLEYLLRATNEFGDVAAPGRRYVPRVRLLEDPPGGCPRIACQLMMAFHSMR
jgi:hypothetical protein